MKVTDRGTVFEAQINTNRQSCAFPSICVLPSGRWISSFRAAPTKIATTGQHVLISYSDNEGRSWSEPVSPFSPAKVNDRPGLFRAACLTTLGESSLLASILWVDHSDPAIPFFNEETQGLLDCRIFFSSSHDGGETWSEPIIMDTSPFNVPTPITGPTLLLSDGRLACQFELNKPYYDTSIWRHSSVMMFSADGGITWPEYAVTSNDPENRIFYWDQRLGVLADGSILDMFWTYDNRAGQYLNIHAKRSTDNGHSWSDTWDTGVPGQPAQPVSTPDAGIAMVYVDRTDQPVIKVRKSSDRGSTWPEETEAVIHKPSLVSQTRKKGAMQDAWEEMGKFSIGLPTTALLPNGNVIVVFYAGPETDRTDIHWACVNL